MSRFQVILLMLVAAILAGVVIVAMVVLMDHGHRREADREIEVVSKTHAFLNAASTQVRALKGPIAAYRLDVGKYPTSLDELRNRPANTTAWNGPYLDREIPPDPWGNPIQYRVSGDGYELWSFGPDGEDATADDIRAGI